MTSWTLEDDQQLAGLVRDKLSAADIGEQMHKSRNAVIGRVHRIAGKDEYLGLHFVTPQGRHAPDGVVPRKKKRSLGRAALRVKPREVVIPPVVKWEPPKTVKPEGGHTLLTRDDWMCKWPIDRVNNQYVFCDQTRKDWQSGSIDSTCSPYCVDHYRMAYNGAPPSRSTKPALRMGR